MVIEVGRGGCACLVVLLVDRARAYFALCACVLAGFDLFPQLEFVSIANQPLHSGALVLAFAKYCPKVVEVCVAGVPRFWNEESGEKLREEMAQLQV